MPEGAVQNCSGPTPGEAMGEGKILIVDDEKKIVRLVKAYLDREGYTTLEAYDGIAALNTWRRESPDLIVLDVLMPGMDGLEFLREVRQSSVVPIIMLTEIGRAHV